ncbi:MAG: polysaccharide biosynthesis/export family protein [Acidobacteriota bacterium]|nr:polysaccharide biosynthesis/export family protein [Acidobacteriota bacterium]
MLAVIACLLFQDRAAAQNPAPATQPLAPQSARPQTLPTAIPTGSLSDQVYRIGPGDVLDVRVFNRPELSGERRVTEAGRIRLPFIEELRVACLTEAEISQEIIAKYKKFLRDPQVDVFVKEYKSLPVAVIGAVNQPARFQLQRRVRLLELLSYAGGPSNRAGTFIHIIHSNDYDFCQSNPVISAAPMEGKAATETNDPDGGKISILTALSSVSLRDLLNGKLDSNVYIQPGDIVSVPEADQIYVTGAVNRPGAYGLTTKITLTQAIGLAGGINMEGAKGRVRLVRQDPNSDKRTETVYNLGDITKRKIEDVILMPNDIVEVPNSTLRAASRNMLGVSISMLSALPYFIIR